MSSLTGATLLDVTGKIALITGGGSGIGLMAARALAANGAKVYIVGRRKEVLEKAVGANGDLSGKLVAVEGDVASKESLKEVAEAVTEGRLDILINNAGIEGPVTELGTEVESLSGKQIADMHLQSETYEKWDQLFRINTHSVLFATMTLLPLLHASAMRGGDPSVLNTTSVSGMVKWSQNHYAYNASKAAANHLTLMLAHELNFRSSLRVRVNAVAPGYFESEMTHDALQASRQGRAPAAKGTGNPAGRIGTEAEMANIVLFFATNGFVTGQIVACDGGYSTAIPGSR